MLEFLLMIGAGLFALGAAYLGGIISARRGGEASYRAIRAAEQEKDVREATGRVEWLVSQAHDELHRAHAAAVVHDAAPDDFRAYGTAWHHSVASLARILEQLRHELVSAPDDLREQWSWLVRDASVIVLPLYVNNIVPFPVAHYVAPFMEELHARMPRLLAGRAGDGRSPERIRALMEEMHAEAETRGAAPAGSEPVGDERLS